MRLTEMTPKQKRIAIAEACRWKYVKSKRRWNSPMGGWDYYCDLPDYLNDLNAMHEAEKILSELEYDEFERYLAKLGQGNTCSIASSRSIISATAAQRADAFLLATGRATV